jgi:hypothetical protein
MEVFKMNKTLRMVSLLCGLTAIAVLALVNGFVGTANADFDRNACYSNCPCDGDPSMWGVCAECKEQCDEEFWKDFDRRMGDVEGKKKKSSN